MCPARTSALEGPSETTWRKALFYKWGNWGWVGDTASQRQALVFLSPFYRCRNGGTDTGWEPRNPDIQSGTLSNLSPMLQCPGKGLGGTGREHSLCSRYASSLRCCLNPPPPPWRLLDCPPPRGVPTPTLLCYRCFHERGSWLSPGKGAHATQYFLPVTSPGRRA